MYNQGAAPLTRFYLGTFWLYAADQFVLLAARWGVVTARGSALTLALVFILHALPQVAVGVLGPQRVGGHRRLPIVALLGAVFLAPVSLLALAYGGGPLIPLLLTAALLAGWTNAVAVPLGQASLMQSLPTGQRVRGSRGYEIASRIPMLAAPVVGGALLGLLGAGQLIVWASVVLLLAAWSYPRWPSPAALPSAPFGSFGQSLRVLRDDRWLFTAMLVRAVSNLVWPAFSLGLPLIVALRLHAGALSYGVLLSSYGVATLLAAGFSARLRLGQLHWLYYVSWVLTGFGFMLLATAPSMPVAALAAVLSGIGSPLIHMALDSHIGTKVAPEAQSAVFGFQRLVISLVGLGGSYAVGLWLTVAAPGEALAGSGDVLAAVGAAGALVALLRRRSAAESEARASE